MRSRAARTSSKAGGSGSGRRLDSGGAARIVVTRQPLQEIAERSAVVLVERRKVLVLDLLGQLAQPREVALAVGGDADDMAPAVLRVALAGDQAALLEGVEHGDEPAGVDVQRARDRRLRLRRALGEDRQHAVVVVLEAFPLEERDRLHLEPEAHAREQEAVALQQLFRDAGGRAELGDRWIHCEISVARKGSSMLWLHRATIKEVNR